MKDSFEVLSERIAELEVQLAAVQRELDEAKPIAEAALRWTYGVMTRLHSRGAAFRALVKVVAETVEKR